MHATVKQSGRSPKQTGSSLVTTQLRSSSDGMQNSNILLAQGKGKKRERVDQGFDSAKRDRTSQKDDIDIGSSRYGSLSKTEIMKIADKGGLVDVDGVERMIQLMQHERGDRKIDLESRSLLTGVIAATDNLDCLSWFVQLRGLPVLDEWLQEAHKSKTDDGTRILDGDTSVEDFLFILLRALDKLPVNLNALQTCNVGKSVNHLRTCKNTDIQKKARSLVDTWKKRVEAEMGSSDGRNSSNQAVQWCARTRNSTVASEAACRTSSVKPLQGDIVMGLRQLSTASSLDACSKDGQPRVPVDNSALYQSHPATNDDRSNRCDQSHNSFSCDRPKTVSSDETRSSSSESLCGNKVLYGSSNQLRSVNGVSDALGRAPSSGSFLLKNPPKRLLQPNVTFETCIDLPVSEGRYQKIVEHGSSPERSSSEGPSMMDESSSNEYGGISSRDEAKMEALEQNDLKSETSMSDKDSRPGPYSSMLDMGYSRGPEVATTTTSLPEDEIRCVKLPESCLLPSAGNNVIANAVSGEMSKPETFSVSGTPKSDNLQNDNDEPYHQHDSHGNDKGIVTTIQHISVNASLHDLSSTDVSKNDQTSIIPQKKAGEVAELLESHEKRSSCGEQKVTDCEEGLRYYSDNGVDANATTDGNSGNEKALSVLVADKINATEAVHYVNDNIEEDDTFTKGVSSVYSESVAKSEEKIPGPEGHVDKRMDEACCAFLSPQSENNESDGGVEKTYESKEVTEQCVKSEQSRQNEVDESHEIGVAETDTRIEFDLNEGLDADGGKCVESMNLSPPSFSAPFQLPVSAHTFGFPCSVTVAAAAKRPFVPPDDLLVSKGELGWKGSAATSAFRPAEPRKLILAVDTSSNVNTNKKNHFPLAIDLNVPHESIFEELGSTSCSLGRVCGGLDLDLNSNDAQCSTSIACLPAKPSITCKSNIDLNNGPGVDEASFEPVLLNQHARCISLQSMTCAEIGNYRSWLPAGTGIHTSLYPEHFVAGEQPRAHTASGLFQYPMFPFGTSFPLQSVTSSVVSTDYVDSGKLFFPSVRGHIAPTGLISSQLLKPYSEEGNRIWVRPGLDLNAGPGVCEMDGRDEMLPFASRQLSAGTSHVFLEEHARACQASGSRLRRNDCKPSLWH